MNARCVHGSGTDRNLMPHSSPGLRVTVMIGLASRLVITNFDANTISRDSSRVIKFVNGYQLSSTLLSLRLHARYRVRSGNYVHNINC